MWGYALVSIFPSFQWGLWATYLSVMREILLAEVALLLWNLKSKIWGLVHEQIVLHSPLICGMQEFLLGKGILLFFKYFLLLIIRGFRLFISQFESMGLSGYLLPYLARMDSSTLTVVAAWLLHFYERSCSPFLPECIVLLWPLLLRDSWTSTKEIALPSLGAYFIQFTS